MCYMAYSDCRENQYYAYACDIQPARGPSRPRCQYQQQHRPKQYAGVALRIVNARRALGKYS